MPLTIQDYARALDKAKAAGDTEAAEFFRGKLDESQSLSQCAAYLWLSDELRLYPRRDSAIRRRQKQLQLSQRYLGVDWNDVDLLADLCGFRDVLLDRIPNRCNRLFHRRISFVRSESSRLRTKGDGGARAGCTYEKRFMVSPE